MKTSIFGSGPYISIGNNYPAPNGKKEKLPNQKPQAPAGTDWTAIEKRLAALEKHFGIKRESHDVLSFRDYIGEAEQAPKPQSKAGKMPWGAAIGAGVGYAASGVARGYLKAKYGIHIPDGGMGDAVIAAGGAAIGGVAHRLFSGTKREKGKPIKDPENWRQNPVGKTKGFKDPRWNNGDTLPKQAPGMGDSQPKRLPADPLPIGARRDLSIKAPAPRDPKAKQSKGRKKTIWGW